MTTIPTKNDFNLYIEGIKQKHEFDTYIETIAWFSENESDQEMEQIVRLLNKKIIEEIRKEAMAGGLLKDKEETVTLIL